MDWFFSICIAPSIEFHCWNPSSRIQVGNQESNLIIQLEMSSKTQIKKQKVFQQVPGQIVPSSNSCARSRRSNRSTCSSPFVPPGPCCQSSRALGWPSAKPWRVWGATNSCPGSTVSTVSTCPESFPCFFQSVSHFLVVSPWGHTQIYSTSWISNLWGTPPWLSHEIPSNHH